MRPALVAATLLAGLLLGSAPSTAGRAAEVRVRSFELLNEGVAAFNRGDYPLAVEKLSESASMALNSFRAHYYLGRALVADRQYPEAVKVLAVALDLDPNHMQSLVALGDAHLKQGEITEARAAYARALQLRPEFPSALDGLGRSYEAQAKTDQAIAHYRRAIASNKGFAPAYTHLGDLYLRQDDLEEAVRLLEEAIDIRPDYAPGLNRLALAYGRLGLHNEAVATIQEAIQLEPKNPMHLVTRGRLQLGQGFVSGAEKSFHEAMALEEAMPEARAGIGAVAYRRGDFDTALAEFDAALADPRLDRMLAGRLAEYREVVAAEAAEVALLDAKVKEQTATPEEYSRLAELCVTRALWDLAAEFQAQGPDTPEQRERLAYILFKARRYRDSHEIYAELSSRSESPELRLNTGIALAKLGNDAGAVEAYRRVLEIDGENRRAWIYLGNSLLRLGDRGEAAEAYRRSLEMNAEDEAAERIRRILLQVAPDLIPEEEEPPPPPVEEEEET